MTTHQTAATADVDVDTGDEVSGAPDPNQPLSKFDLRKAATRAKLIAAAQALLAEGRTSASIRDISALAGTGFGSFFNHFESKEHLFEAAVRETLLAYAELRDQLVADIEDPAEVFAASFRLTGRLQRLMPEQVKVFLHSGTAVLTRDEGLAPRARHDLAAAVAAGRFDLDDIELGLMAAGGALLGLMQMLDAHPELDDAEISDRFTERVLRALGLSSEDAAELSRRPLSPLPDLS